MRYEREIVGENFGKIKNKCEKKKRGKEILGGSGREKDVGRKFRKWIISLTPTEV
jgi:hypothetical protein